MEKLDRKTQIRILSIIFIMLVIGLAILFPFLPDKVPMQYSLTGSVNRYADKWVAILGAIGINGALSLYNIFTSEDVIPAKNFIVSAVLPVVTMIAIGAALFIQ